MHKLAGRGAPSRVGYIKHMLGTNRIKKYPRQQNIHFQIQHVRNIYYRQALFAHSPGMSNSRETNNSTGSASTSIARLQGLVVVTTAKVIRSCVHYDRTAYDTSQAIQRNQFISQNEVCCARRVALDITQVANMARGVRRSAVRLAVRVEVAPRRQTTAAQVAGHVDVESAPGVRVEAFDVSGDRDRLSRRRLLEGHGARHGRVAAQHDHGLGDRGSAGLLEKYPIHVVHERQDGHYREEQRESARGVRTSVGVHGR